MGWIFRRRDIATINVYNLRTKFTADRRSHSLFSVQNYGTYGANYFAKREIQQ